MDGRSNMMMQPDVRYLRLDTEKDSMYTPVYVAEGVEVTDEQLEQVLSLARQMLQSRGLTLVSWSWLSEVEARRLEMETIWKWHRIEEAWEHGDLVLAFNFSSWN